MSGAKSTQRRQPSEPRRCSVRRLAPTRRELVLLGVVLTAGIATRVWAVSHSAVEHFDEGVYASNIYFGAPDYAYPQQRFYAPPLLPALIEAGMIAGLPPNLAALLPSFLAGCGTIVALWWFGRSWFGPEVGLAAAALAALNDFHIAFSATALTDVLLGLWLVLAVDAIGRSLVNGDRRWAIGAGIYTGLAWWTKYNGWLPLAIEAAALPVLWFFLRPPRKQLQRWLACFAITALVAAAIWSPHFLSLQRYGGYGPIAANHAKYVVGVAGWFHSAGTQIANQIAIGFVWSVLGVAFAMFAFHLMQEPRTFLRTLWLAFNCLMGAIVLMLFTASFVVGVGAALGLSQMLVALHRAPKLDAIWTPRAIGLFLVLTWWAALLVATPLYSPYPRLLLPCLLAAYLGAALLAAPELVPAEPQAEPSRWSGCLFVGLIICGNGLLVPIVPHQDHWERSGDRRGLVRVAEQIRATDIRVGGRVIYVYGEPALFFQLRAAGEELVSPIQEIPSRAAMLEGKAIPTLLIAGPHAHRDPEFVRQFDAVQDRWELVQEFDYQPSAIVWLDLNDPRRSPKETEKEDRIRMYRLRP